MKNILTYGEFINESLNEGKKQKFLLYTNPNNSTNAAYVAIGAADVREVLSSAKRYSDSYRILYQGNGTQDDLVKAKQMFSNYRFGNESIDEGFMSDLDIIGRESKTVKDFIKKAIQEYPSLRGGEAWLEELWTSLKSIDENLNEAKFTKSNTKKLEGVLKKLNLSLYSVDVMRNDDSKIIIHYTAYTDRAKFIKAAKEEGYNILQDGRSTNSPMFGQNWIAIDKSINEAAGDTLLYKIYFKPEYSKESDSTNKAVSPVFVQMNTDEKDQLEAYAAIKSIDSLGKTTPARLLSRQRIGVNEMSFSDLFRLVKSLYRVTFRR
jgi:hypothetical protein